MSENELAVGDLVKIDQPGHKFHGQRGVIQKKNGKLCVVVASGDYSEIAIKWDDMNPEQRRKYLEKHPNSKHHPGHEAKKQADAKKKAAAPKKPRAKKAETPKSDMVVKTAEHKNPVNESPKNPEAHQPRPQHRPPEKEAEHKGFYPKKADQWHPPKKGPGYMDTLKEMFGLKRATYSKAELAKMAGIKSHKEALDFITASIKHLNSSSPVTLSIQKIRSIDPNHAVVAASLSRNATHEEVALTFAQTVEGMAAVIPDTIKLLSNSVHPVISFAVRKNVFSQPFDENAFTEIAKGVAVDANDQVWKIEGEGEGRRVILESADDIDALLNARKTRGSINTASSNLNVINPQHGDYVCYVNTASGELDFGFTYNTTNGQVVVAKDGSSIGLLKNDCVIEAAAVDDFSLNGLKPYETLATLGEARLSDVIDYLKKAYHDNYGMLEKYEELLKSFQG